MPYCLNCGHQFPKGSRFCPECGASVSDSQPSPGSETGSIVFCRQPSAIAKYVRTRIIVDGVLYGDIRENERLVVELPFGVHSVSIRCAMYPLLVEKVSVSSAVSIKFVFSISENGQPVRIEGSALTESGYGGPPTRERKKKDKHRKKRGEWIVLIVLILAIAFAASQGYLSSISAWIEQSFFTKDSRYTPQQISTPIPSATRKPVATPVPTLAPTPVPTHQTNTGTVGNWQITFNSFYYANSISAGLLREYQAEDGSQFVVINLTVKNLGKEAAVFLPYAPQGNDAVVKIVWNDYEYSRSELQFAKDSLSSEMLNPLVSTSGDIAFILPNELIASDTPPVLKFTVNNQTLSCTLNFAKTAG